MSVRTFLLVVLLSVGSGSLLATGAAFAAGDPEKGRVAAATCVACHGQDGATGLDGTYPNIAGQNEKYLTRQLQMIRDNERAIPLMTGFVVGKSDEELADIAAYYASLPAKQGVAEGGDDEIANAVSIYRAGIARKGVAACTACHNPSGAGNAQAGFPRIAGQPIEYTVAQLTAYRENQRRSDEEFGGMMRDIAEGLTDTEIAQLADYIRGLY